jgi:serine/threonine-protein kinase
MSRGKSGPISGQVLAASQPNAMPFREGDVIAGKYEVLRLLGSGGMGFVVAAKHIELDEQVALKFLRLESLTNRELVARFAREARASVKIKSEHVSRVFDVGTMPDGAPFIVMEYLDGKDLCAILGDQGPLPIASTAEYVMQACEALASAHAMGIVHRDIKPENLFLTRRAHGVGVIKVLDFGISKVALTGSAFDTNLPLVKTTAILGSPMYMSPEQLRTTDEVDTRTDIWSLGCVLFELLTGRLPFDAPSITTLTAAILEQAPPKVRSLRADVPPELEAVVGRCLEKSPDRRFQDVAELAAALFPFAPRRARLSVERCRQILRSAGLSHAESEVPSAPPPSTRRMKLATTLPARGGLASPTRPRRFVSLHRLFGPSGSSRRKIAVSLGALTLLVSGALALRSSPSAMGNRPDAQAQLQQAPAVMTAPEPAPQAAEQPEVVSPLELEAPRAIMPASSAAKPKPKPANSASKSNPPPRSQSDTTPNQDLDVGF